MSKRKFKHGDVVVLHNPKKYWYPITAAKLHGEIGVVNIYRGCNLYEVKHIRPRSTRDTFDVNDAMLFSIDVSEMEKIGVL